MAESLVEIIPALCFELGFLAGVLFVTMAQNVGALVENADDRF